MSVRNLEFLLRPRSVAVIGASTHAGRVGSVVMRNLLRGGFEGAVFPVNPKHAAVAGVLSYPDVAQLPRVPDLAVVCTPPAAVPDVVRALADAGTRAAVVLTAGLSQATDARGHPLSLALREAAGRRGFRVLGPNSLGLLIPSIGLDASFAHVPARPGHLAFLSQSGAVGTVALEWARDAELGFSCFASLGDAFDVDVADLLDWFGADPGTRAILLYLETVGPARKFLSAARAAARNKPVVVLKAGRAAEGARAAFTHTGALAGADDVCDAALRRAGVLRVDRIDQLFDAAETLVRSPRLRGDRVAIVSNGGGLGVMATDCLVARGGRLAALSPDTIAALDAALPPTWSRGNPVDIVGDASGERYAAAMRALLADPGVDVLLALHAPTAIASSEDAARAVAGVVGERRADGASVLTSWLGRAGAEPARRLLREAGIPTYDTPEDALDAVAHLLGHRRSQELLMETPPSLPADFAPRRAEARAVIEAALAEGRSWLDVTDAMAVLSAYGVPGVATRSASDGEEAARIAAELGFPVALKIVSPDLTHKSDVGGVALDLETPEAVREAAGALRTRLAAHRGDARLSGFLVQPMLRRAGSVELLAGVACDEVFGPVVVFGQGGVAVERIGDRALALPPLNLNLARELIGRTRVARLLGGFRDRPAVDEGALALALVQVAQIAVDLPEAVELDVNPLLADPKGVVALDARIRVARVPCSAVGTPTGARAADRLAIRPYPQELEEHRTLRGGRRVLLRPIRPEDEPAHQAFFESLEPEDVRFRFFNLVRAIPHSQMARFTQIDYAREMAFLAVPSGDGASPETFGVVRAAFDPDGREAEFAIVVSSALKGQGLGHALLEKMIRYCRARGTREVVGQVLPDNRPMLDLARDLGFASRFLPEEGVVEVRLTLETGARPRTAPR
jgi:acetyltransferase